MSRRPRRNHSPAFKAKVVLAAAKGELTLVNDFLAGTLGKAGLLPRANDDRPFARRQLDEEDGDRGDLPPPEHLKAVAGAQDEASRVFRRRFRLSHATISRFSLAA